MPEFFYTPHIRQLLSRILPWSGGSSGGQVCPLARLFRRKASQLIDDAITVTHYLRNRVAKEKIALLGHSWGSFLEIQVAAATPELYNARIGVGQVAYQLRSEVAAHGYLLEHYQARGDAAMVRKPNAAPVSMTEGLSAGWLHLRDGAMHRLEVGTMRDMSSVITGVFIPVWQCRAYKVGEKVNIWRGIACSRDMLG